MQAAILEKRKNSINRLSQMECFCEGLINFHLERLSLTNSRGMPL